MAKTKSGRTILPTDATVEAERLPNETLLDLLRAKGVGSVVFAYDGGGDDGQVGDAVAYPKGVDPHKQENAALVMELPDAFVEPLRDLAFSILGHYCPGDWVNNEGGYGSILIVLGEDGVDTTLEFSQRVITTEDSTTDIGEAAVNELIAELK